ncbi:MAG: hypothetical protein ACLQSR_10735 [Limisphaerales bacterium]
MKLLSVTELKSSAGEILDRAMEGKPQFVVRGGGVVMISRAELLAGVQKHPEGYFADAYGDTERISRERRASNAVKFAPER